VKKPLLSAALLEVVVPGAVLLLLSFLFWKFRIFDSGVNPTIEVGPVDLYIEIPPMNEYGFTALRAGHLPLWNPYQFCGEPFLAMAYVGLLYPFHLMNLWFDVLTSLEISFVFHMFFGALGMWCLARHFRSTSLGGLCAAMTFAWSGWLILNNVLPGVFEAITWMPLTVLLLDLVLEGRRWAWIGLILALTCQLLIGVPEILLHTLYAGGVFVLCRMVEMSWRGAWRSAVRGAAVICASGAIAVLLAAPQLLPAAELTQQSARAAGSLTLAQALYPGVIPAPQFLRAAVGNAGAVTVGVLPLLGLGLVIGWRRYRLVWIAGTVAAVGAALLVFGEPVYRYYFAIPVIGSMFRRPMKFLDIYSFAQSLLVGLAVTRLQTWSDIRRRELWLHPGWLAALAVGVAGLVWLASLREVNWYWVAALVLLLLFGLVGRRAVRLGLLTALCVVQAASLFFTTGDTHVRPVKRPEIFHRRQELLDTLKRNLGDARVYLSSKFWFWPDLTAKQGLLNKMAVSIDYEPLAVERYARFFTAITPGGNPTSFGGAAPFAGAYYLMPGSHWWLMDLTGTKYFVMLRGEPGDVFMSQNQAEFRPIYDRAFARVFERQHVLPRAYFVSRARTLSSPDAVLAALDTPSFDPRLEVLLEDPESDPLPAPAAEASAAVHISSYEPERVEIEADVSAPGYLVLTDLHYPGWKAFVDDREEPISRADYLFRAVRLAPGHSVVRFEYQPRSFRIGIALSAAAAVLIAVAAAWNARRTN
jgi:hypothetical protein